MGYEMYQRDAEFTLKAEYKARALAAIKVLAAQPGHLMWIDKRNIEAARTLEEALEEWGWQTRPGIDETDDIVSIYFSFEKAGDEEKLFIAIAPFVEAGSYIEMQGEDGERWRWCFDGQMMVRKKPHITWGT